MTITVTLNLDHLNHLDLSPIQVVIEPLLQEQQALLNAEQQLRFEINYPRESTDPRELSEIPAVRLWFLRLDAHYPWLPLLLDWRSGELARYTAMLVPHQFSRSEGIQYNPEALEIFVMHKTFVLLEWMQQQGIEGISRIKAMAQMLGYELADSFFDLLRA